MFLQKLKALKIDITWDVPYQQKLNRTNHPKPETLEKMRKYLELQGLQLKKKELFTPSEDATIKTNWDEFSFVSQ